MKTTPVPLTFIEIEIARRAVQQFASAQMALARTQGQSPEVVTAAKRQADIADAIDDKLWRAWN